MKFLLDESAEYRIAHALRVRGHDVTAIAHDYPRALPDIEVLAIAVAEQRILITNDRDFGELIVRQKLPHTGVIYSRLELAAPVEEKIAVLQRLLSSHQHHLNQFLVVTPRGLYPMSVSLSDMCGWPQQAILNVGRTLRLSRRWPLHVRTTADFNNAKKLPDGFSEIRG